MQDLTSPTPAESLQASIAQVLSIYERLLPDHQIRFIFREGADPTWGAPEVHFGPFTFTPAHLGADYIGQVLRKGRLESSPEATVTIAIPPRATPGVARGQEPAWDPRRLSAVFALKPLLYETLRYSLEMRRKRKATSRHEYASLPRGGGSETLAGASLPPVAGSQKPAIIIGFHWLEVGGAEKLAFDCVNWALAAGLRVLVVASVRSTHRLANRLPDHPDVTFIRLDLFLPDQLWPIFISRLIETENVRLVHIHHCNKLYESLPQIKALHPWVQVIDSTHIVEHSDGGYPRISGVWSNFIDTHHVISRDLADYYRDTFHVMGKVQLGRMLTRSPDGAPKVLPPLTFSAGKKTLHISFVGRLYYQKRPIVVVEAFRALAAWARRAGVHMTGTLVGEGPFENAVRALMKRYGLAGQIEMQPANANIPALLNKSDILLLPSNNEGLALVCYEAVEHGCLPISTDVGAQREALPPGLLVPLAPSDAVRQSVEIVDRLWRSSEALNAERDALHKAWRALEADLTAEELLSPIYRAALEAGTSAKG